MCRKILKQIIITVCLLLGLLFCYCVQISADGGTTNQTEPKQTITMSMADWDELKTEFTAQSLELNQLRQKLIMLKMDSGEQMKQLETRRDADIINECESIVERCQERSNRIKNIIRRVEEQNKENRAQASSHT